MIDSSGDTVTHFEVIGRYAHTHDEFDHHARRSALAHIHDSAPFVHQHDGYDASAIVSDELATARWLSSRTLNLILTELGYADFSTM